MAAPLRLTRSRALYDEACGLIPGGVNSAVRAFRGVGGTPVFMARADGAWIEDVDGNRYIDYVGSWGPMILGHNAPEIRAAMLAQIERGVGYGTPTEVEVEMARMIRSMMPAVEMVRMVTSGTEATMSALRLARAATGRNVIVKFEGCYHGHTDSLLIKAGSSAMTLGVPSSPGVPAALAQLTLNLPYNDIEALGTAFERHGNAIAGVIVEPVAGNMNCVPPAPGFLQAIRDRCDESGALLIFDEVMTGFRVAPGGAQQLYGIRPDLTTLGKVIGGGLPVGAFGGRADLMEQIAPSGPVFHAGTLAGNPLAMHAGLAALSAITEDGFHTSLARSTDRLVDGARRIAAEAGVPFTTNHVCGMFGWFFTDRPVVTCLDDVNTTDIARFQAFFHAMLARGVYLAPSAFEAGFVSRSHDDEVVDQTLERMRDALGSVKQQTHRKSQQ